MLQLIARRRRSVAAVGLAAGLLLGMMTAAWAAGIVRSGHAVSAVKVATADAYDSAGGNGYTNVPGMSVTETVPANSKAIFLITFSAESVCSASSSCYVKVLMNGSDLINSTYALVTFASRDMTTNSMQWVSAPLEAGTYTFRIQQAAAVDQTITMYNRTLSVLRSTV